MFNAAVTVKTMWWDKLTPEEKQKHIDSAKTLAVNNAQLVISKAKDFTEKAKNKKATTVESELVEEAEIVEDTVSAK